MIGAFSFNEVETENFNLVCKSVKRPLLPPAKAKRIILAGASGAYDFDDGEYGIRQVTMRIAYIRTSFGELHSRVRSIAAWLSTTSWVRLIINDEPDKITDEIELQSLWESGTADISFDCRPFAYAVQEQTVPGGIFTNPGTRQTDYKSPQGSKFIITATVGTSATFTMNGKTLTYSGTDGVLVIDNVNMEATMNEQNVFGKLGGVIDTFFTVKPVQNTIS